jgi:hypothetical protein
MDMRNIFIETRHDREEKRTCRGKNLKFSEVGKVLIANIAGSLGFEGGIEEFGR